MKKGRAGMPQLALRSISSFLALAWEPSPADAGADRREQNCEFRESQKDSCHLHLYIPMIGPPIKRSGK